MTLSVLLPFLSPTTPIVIDERKLSAAIRAACLLEVTARKPGNVHPLAAFDDCDWESFADSAEAIAPVLAEESHRSVGSSILKAVEATQNRVGRNTNLGMILLLAPLAAAVSVGDNLPSALREVLASLTLRDTELVYEAIRLSKPGGLGNAETEDVASSPTVGLIEAMRLAADRDDVAKQFVCGFADVFAMAEYFEAESLPALEWQIIAAHVRRIASDSDTLIRRKCGSEVAAEASRLAAGVIADGLLETSQGRESLARFDKWLRADGNRRNPGTTADLIAAALFVAIHLGRLRCFEAAEIMTYAETLRSATR